MCRGLKNTQEQTKQSFDFELLRFLTNLSMKIIRQSEPCILSIFNRKSRQSAFFMKWWCGRRAICCAHAHHQICGPIITFYFVYHDTEMPWPSASGISLTQVIELTETAFSRRHRQLGFCVAVTFFLAGSCSKIIDRSLIGLLYIAFHFVQFLLSSCSRRQCPS